MTQSLSSPVDLRIFINIQKLSRHELQNSDVTIALESARAASYTKEYFRGLQFGVGLPVTELQPADDLVILASNVLVNLWHLSDDEAHLYSAAALLEFAATKSEHSFRIRLLLIRIYRLLGMSPKYASLHPVSHPASRAFHRCLEFITGTLPIDECEASST